MPLVFACITNDPICGQSISMGSIREIDRVAHKYDSPLIFDAARWAENSYFIKMNEDGYADKSIAEIAAELANVVRFAIDRSRLTREHLDYVIAAVKALYEDRERIPNMRITWGHSLPMRHFHAFLEPYPNKEK